MRKAWRRSEKSWRGRSQADDGLVQGDEDGVEGALGVVVALVEHLTPGIEETKGGGGVGYFVAEIVGDAAVGVDALEVGADFCWEEEGGYVEVFVVSGGEMTAPGAGFGEGGAVFGREVLGWGSVEAVGLPRRGFRW